MDEKSNLIERLWRNNWLNIRKATDVAQSRNPHVMFVGIELANTVLNNANGTLFPYAQETLGYIKTGSNYKIIVSTYLDDSYVTNMIRSYKLPIDWVNANPCFQTSKPFFDCYIDAAAGFHAGEWLYVLEMFKLSEKQLNETSHIKLKI
jgi:hypothetical protein